LTTDSALAGFLITARIVLSILGALKRPQYAGSVPLSYRHRTPKC
jgi:hypothetical protein